MSAPSPPLRVFYFAAEGVFSPVLDSQVIVPLRLMGLRAPEMARALLILTSVRHMGRKRMRERMEAIRRSLPDVRVLFKYRLFGDLAIDTWIRSRQLSAAIRESGFSGEAPIILHCRGERAGAPAATVKRRDPRLRLLLDLRGDTLDEVARIPFRGRYLVRRGRSLLRQALAGADGLNVVSNRLADLLKEREHWCRDVPRTVVGCCVDTQRFYYDAAVREAKRRELGLDGKFVVCYCGAMMRWQRPDALAEAFAAIRAAMPDAHFLVVSREAALLEAEFAKRGVSPRDVTIRAVSHDQVAPHMMAADVALLLRENTVANQVASPVKFAEYLRSGLPVILTPYIGDFGRMAVEEDLGATVEFPIRADEVVRAARKIRDRLGADGEAYRTHCSEVAARRLSWDGQLSQLMGLYRRLAGGA
jgi:glycosyltransferase involved in cell wall biosynthesis